MDLRGRIAVVGGGPAGATCARLLSVSGFDVTLFESRPDGEKPCGGGVPAAALSEFPLLADPSLRRRVVNRVLVHSPSGLSVAAPVPGGIHVFKRCELDSFLRAAAAASGASVRHERVIAISRGARARWRLATDSGEHGPFDFLVGADGVNGIVRRSVSSPPDRRDLTIGLYAYADGGAATDMVLKFFGGFDGYLWIFPRSDHVSVGICATHRSVEIPRLEELLHRFVEERSPGTALRRGSLRGYFIPSEEHPPAGASGDNWALIGDAGGFVDPLTREGIAPAMRSASVLSEALRRFGRFATPPLSENLRCAHRYRRGFFQRAFVERVVRLAAASPSIRRVLGDLLAGRQPYTTLKPRLLLNAIPCGLQLAARALGSGF